MDGFISAYRLTTEVGQKIASIKEMPEAWSNPSFLPKLFSNPGPLFFYDKLYLDERSYIALYDSLDEPMRTNIKNYIESKELAIFELINAESILLQNSEVEVNKIESAFRDLYKDSQFVDTVATIITHWGNYAAPTPYKFEAMNIPVVELLCKKWSQKLSKNLNIIDNPERLMLYKISKHKNYSKIIAPEISKIIIDLVPQYFAIIPKEVNWNINTIRRIRENKYLINYRNEVEKIANETAKQFEESVKQIKFPPIYENCNIDILTELYNSLTKVRLATFDKLTRTHTKLKNSVGVNEWSVLGAIVGTAGITLARYLPGNILEYGLGVVGYGFVLIEQITNYYKQKNTGWVNFLEFVSNETKRSNIQVNII